MDAFATYCDYKEKAAVAARLSGFYTVADRSADSPVLRIGNTWSRALFDGDFYRTAGVLKGVPQISLVFVQSKDGNTVAANPSTLGGGESDKHLIYEGLSRVDSDAVMAGATTARGERMVFSVWHPELVTLRLATGQSRHPAQVVVTNRGELPIEKGLMFNEPSLRVFLITRTGVATALRHRVGDRRWVEVINGGDPLSLRIAMEQLLERGIRVVSCVGGRTLATVMIGEELVSDIYLTTSPEVAGQPGTPFYDGPPLRLRQVIQKAGRGEERGVKFEHLVIQR